MIKIGKKEVEYIEGMTVADALNLTGEKVDQMVIIVIDGKVISKNELDITKISDNTSISLLRLVSGG